MAIKRLGVLAQDSGLVAYNLKGGEYSKGRGMLR